MTHYKTNDLDPCKKLFLFGNLVGNVGNNNIRWCHIKFLKDKVLETGENKYPDISLAPYYYAWLFLIVEQVFWYLREFAYYHSELDAIKLTSQYSKSIELFLKICIEKNLYENSEIKKIEDELHSILLIRHALVHNGFPNLLPVQLRQMKIKKPGKGSKKGKNNIFNKKEIKDAIKMYSNPKNFELINESITETITLILKLPQFSVGF